ncbi:TRAF3-interacting protein 1-like isoform X2 [Lineus longissimus]|uniref:TRAF3-interacting protein 1-like isoform X2 n=1 Tax=Lineus longissimus TaxID=88925 RepID=UPI00315D87AD
MDDKIVKKTQDSLGKVIKKPPLTEKLLKKPPFRFLHDILTSVIKNTGTMKGLYTENELNSDQIKDKDSKMAFLQKAVDFVSLVVGKPLSVRPSKIVAGHEPEKTNEFLQELATACNKKIDNDDYVKRALKGEKPGESSKPPRGSSKREEKKDKESRDDKRRERDGSGKENRERQGSGSRDRGKEREKDDKKESRSSKDREGSRDRGERERSRDRRDKDKENKEERKKRHRDRERDRDKEAEKKKEDETAPVLNIHANGDGNESVTPEADEAPSEPPAARIPRPSSAKGSRRRHREDEDEQFRAEKRDEEAVNGTVGEDDLPPQVMAARRMARPASARPAPPKIKPKTDTTQEPDIRVGSGKHVTNVIVDDDNPSDDDDNFMVEDTAIPPPEPEPVVRQSEVEEDGEHGGLVKKMLETKKELEGGSQKAGARREVEKPMVSDAARRKEREMVQKEIDKLRGSIQTLTRSANPLGKIMDYVQEDLDSMQKENEKWKKENKEHTLSLKQEQSVTEMSIEPLKGQLKDLDQLIADQLVLIAAVKSNIVRNDEKIGKMLGSVSKS